MADGAAVLEWAHELAWLMVLLPYEMAVSAVALIWPLLAAWLLLTAFAALLGAAFLAIYASRGEAV